MKILVFTTLYPNNIFPNFGVFVKERMTSFARLEECQVRVVAPVPYFPPVKIGSRWKYSQVVAREVLEGIEVFHPRYFMTPKVGMALYGLMMFFSVLPAVLRLKKAFDFDLIDAHYVYPDGLAAVLLGRFFKKPVVVTARGSDIHLFAKFSIIRRLLCYTLHKADHVVAVSGALQQAITRLGIPAKKISVIPNGVDNKKFYRFSKREARARLALPPNETIILSVGRLLPVKGYDLLIVAFKKVLENFREKNLRLIIIGEGESRLDLEKMIGVLGLNEHVILQGAVPHRELYLWYNVADLFCLASEREGWPNVVLEAMACGTPVVATNVWGIPEIIVSEELGLLARREEREIAEAINTALNRNWQSEIILQYTQDKTWDKVALAVADVFQSVLAAEKCYENSLSPSHTI
jgi:glycosyltransferase involved in cell wall biosynthesis